MIEKRRLKLNFSTVAYSLLILTILGTAIYFLFFYTPYATYKLDPAKKNYISERLKLSEVWFLNNYDRKKVQFYKITDIKSERIESGSIESNILGLDALIKYKHLYPEDLRLNERISYLKKKIDNYVDKNLSKLNNHVKAQYIILIYNLKILGYQPTLKELNNVKNILDNFSSIDYTGDYLSYNGDIIYSIVLANNYLIRVPQLFVKSQVAFRNYMKNYGDSFFSPSRRKDVYWLILYAGEMSRIEDNVYWEAEIENIVTRMNNFRSDNGPCFNSGCIVAENTNEFNYIYSFVNVYNLVKQRNSNLAVAMKDYLIKAGIGILNWQVETIYDYKLDNMKLDKRFRYLSLGGFCNGYDCHEMNISENYNALNALLALKSFNFS